MGNQMHLTLDERNIIEQELTNNTSLREIAKLLDKDPSTISKEIKKHRIRKEGQAIHVNFNHCAKRFNCRRKNLCNPRCSKECRHCNHCNSVCSDFIEGTCLRLKRAPYVCNGCSQKYSCKLTKYYYRALPSFNKYKTILSESRQGINTKRDTFQWYTKYYISNNFILQFGNKYFILKNNIFERLGIISRFKTF